MRFHWKVSLNLAVLLLVLLLASCQSDRSLTDKHIEPSPPPTASTGDIQLNTEQPLHSSEGALKACDTSLQVKALRPNVVPRWETMGVDTCYDLMFDLTSGGEEYNGRAAITFTNPGDTSLEEIMLRTYPNAQVIFGGSLEIYSAHANGIDRTLEIIHADETTVRIPLETPLEPDQTLTLELEFTGRLPVDFESGWIYGTFHYATDGPVMQLSNAFPMLALLTNGEWQTTPVLAYGDPVTSQTALFKVEVHAPGGWQVAASGTETSREESGNEVSIQYAGGPLRDFMLAASPAFMLSEIRWDGIQIRLWSLPVNQVLVDRTLEVARDAVKLFDQTFGALPYNELDIVITPLQNASGVEYPGFLLLAERLYIDQESTYLLPLVTSHEVAHQWWYSVVGNDVLEHPWLDEALATYSAQFYAMRYNQTFYEGARLNYQQRVANYEEANGEQAVGQPVTNFDGDSRGYSTIVYNKGDLFLEALRSHMGEKAFDAALSRYYQQKMYRLAQPDDLLDSFESACDCSLEDIYAEWGVLP